MVINGKSKTVNVLMVFLFFLFSFFGSFDFGADLLTGICAADEIETKSILELNPGDKVVDQSWEWEFKTGNGYTGEGAEKPIVWIVVAKDHYSGGDAGSVAGGASHLTLISEELIGRHLFDNSSDRNMEDWSEFGNFGTNHWGESGTTDATAGIRPFLNQNFYNTFGSEFKKKILTTTLPNKEWVPDGEEGVFYTTSDKVFIPSQTEVGGLSDGSYEIGEDWGFFTDNPSRVARLAGNTRVNWLRSPDARPAMMDNWAVAAVNTDGSITTYEGALDPYAFINTYTIRPVVNISANTRVSVEANGEGVYEIIYIAGEEEGCYIATAVYGGYDKKEVVALRSYRDEVLREYLIGRLFIKAYYKLSPPLADFLKDADFLNSKVKLLLDKVVEYVSADD